MEPKKNKWRGSAADMLDVETLDDAINGQEIYAVIRKLMAFYDIDAIPHNKQQQRTFEVAVFAAVTMAVAAEMPKEVMLQIADAAYRVIEGNSPKNNSHEKVEVSDVG